jgi:hypothetical protein
MNNYYSKFDGMQAVFCWEGKLDFNPDSEVKGLRFNETAINSNIFRGWRYGAKTQKTHPSENRARVGHPQVSLRPHAVWATAGPVLQHPKRRGIVIDDPHSLFIL